MGGAQRPARAMLSAALQVAAIPVRSWWVGCGHVGREGPQEPVGDIGGRRGAATGPIRSAVWAGLAGHGWWLAFRRLVAACADRRPARRA